MGQKKQSFEHLAGGSNTTAPVRESVAPVDAALMREVGAMLDMPGSFGRVTAYMKNLERDNADLLEALKEYMSQFGQGLEAHGIPLGPAQHKADEKARAAIAKVAGAVAPSQAASSTKK